MNLGAHMRDIDELKFLPLGCSSEAPPHSSIYQYSNSGGAGGLQRQGYGWLLVDRTPGQHARVYGWERSPGPLLGLRGENGQSCK